MNCFPKFQKWRKGFHIPLPDSVINNFNEIDFKICENELILYCKISLHNNPDYIRVVLDYDEKNVKMSSPLISGTCESVKITKEMGKLRVGNKDISIILQYMPFKISIYKGNLLICVCKIAHDEVKKDSICFVSQMSGKVRLYGLAERAGVSRLKQGQKYRLYNTDEFGLAQGTNKPLYGSVPFITGVLQEYCVGILSLNESETLVNLKRKRLRSTCQQFWSLNNGVFDFVCFISDDGLSLRQSLLKITGSTPLPPLFALGYHQCRWNYDNQEDIMKVEEGLREAGIACDVLWLDIEHTDGKRYFTWDKDKFDPAALVKYLKERGRHLVVIVDPHLKEDPEYIIYREAQEAGYLVKNEDGTTLIGECWPGNSAWVDFISDDASSWWSNKICSYLKGLGSCRKSNSVWIWNDMNEPSVFKCHDNQMTPTAVHANGVSHGDIHNVYGQRMVRATWRGILDACDNNLRPFLLSRSFFTGSQQYGAVWTGDSLCSWDHLKLSVSMVISLSICGIDFCGADVGGFFGDPEPELLCRWYQLGAMQPFFRAHAHIDSKRREPYLCEEPYKDAIKSVVHLRYRLLAYWYLCFWQASTEQSPVVSPTWFHFPLHQHIDDDSTFMIGSSLLVRPIVTPLCLSIDMVMPGSYDDLWYYYCEVSNLWQESHGAQKVEMAVNIKTVPVFYRGGHCIFMKEGDYTTTNEWQQESYHVVMFPSISGDSAGLVYTDDYHSLQYKVGDQYSVHKCSLSRHDKTVCLDTVHSNQGVGSNHEEGSVTKVTIVKEHHTRLSYFTKASCQVNTLTVRGTLHQFQDRLEITDIELRLTGTSTITLS